MECHGYNINPNHQCTMDHLSIIWAHFELQMILCMVKCQTHPQCSGIDGQLPCFAKTIPDVIEGTKEKVDQKESTLPQPCNVL